MKLYLCPNLFTNAQEKALLTCLRQFRDVWQAGCAMSPAHAEQLFGVAGRKDYLSFGPEEADLLVAVGGDGSVLRAAQTAVRVQKPLLGINIGRLGYLCALPLSALTDSTPDLLNGLTLSRRSLLRFSLNGQEHYALNDITVVKSRFGETIELSVHSGATHAHWIGDGIILSTPTGSTAYNHSAGGPVIAPDVPAFCATPICPHSRDTSPMVVSDRNIIRIDLIRSPANTAEIFCDGTHAGDITSHLLVDRHPKDLLLVTAPADS